MAKLQQRLVCSSSPPQSAVVDIKLMLFPRWESISICRVAFHANLDPLETQVKHCDSKLLFGTDSPTCAWTSKPCLSAEVCRPFTKLESSNLAKNGLKVSRTCIWLPPLYLIVVWAAENRAWKQYQRFYEGSCVALLCSEQSHPYFWLTQLTLFPEWEGL